MIKPNNNKVKTSIEEIRRAELAVYVQLDKLNKLRALSKQDQNVLETLKAKGVNTKLYEIEQDLQDVESGLTQLRSVVDDVKQERAKQTVKQQFFDQNDALKSPVAIQEILDNDTTYDLDKEQENTANSEGLKALLSAIYQLNQTVQSKSRQNKQAKQKFCKQIENHVYQYLIGEITASDLQLYLTDLQASKPEKSSELKKLVADIESNKECLKSNQFPFNDPFNVKESKPLTVSLNIDQSVSEAWDEFQELKGEFLDSHSDSTEDEMEDEKNPFESFNEAYNTLLKSPYEDDENEKLTKNDFEILSVPFNFLMESFDRFSQKAKSFFGENNSQKFNEAEQQALQELLNSSLNTETDQQTFYAIQNYIKATGAELEPKEKLLVSIKNLQCQCQSKTQLKQLCDSVLQKPENIDAQTLLEVACHKGTDKQSFDAIQTYLDNAKPNHTQQLFLNIKQLQLQLDAQNDEVKRNCDAILQYATSKRVDKNDKFYQLLKQLSAIVQSDKPDQLTLTKAVRSSIDREFVVPINPYLNRGGDISDNLKVVVSCASADFLLQIGEAYKARKSSNNDAQGRLKKILEIKRENLTDQDQQELAIIDRYLKPEESKSDGMSQGEEPEVVQGKNPNANDPVKKNGSSLEDNKTSYGRGSRKIDGPPENGGGARSARSDPRSNSSSGSATTASTGEEAGEGNGSGLNFSSGHSLHASQERRNSATQKKDDNGAEQSLENLTDELLKFHPGQDGKSPILNEGGQVIDYDALANLNRINGLLLKIDKSERNITSLESQKRSEFKQSVNYIRDEVNAFKPYTDQVYNYNGQLKTESEIKPVIEDKINRARRLRDDFVNKLKNMLDINEKSTEDIRSNSQQYANQLIEKLKESPKQTYLLDEKHAGLFCAYSSRKTDKVRIYAQNPKEGHQFYSYEKNNQRFLRQFSVQVDNQYTYNLIQQIKDNADKICKKVDPPVFDISEASEFALSEYKKKMREKFPQEKNYAVNDDGTRAKTWVKSHPDSEEVAKRLRGKNDSVLRELEGISEPADDRRSVKEIISLLYGPLGRERKNDNSPIAQARAEFVKKLCEQFCQYCQLNDKNVSNNVVEKTGSQEDRVQSYLKQLLKDQYSSEHNQSDKDGLIDNVLNVVQKSLGAKGQKSGKHPGSHDRKMTNVAQKFIDLLQSNNTDNLKQSIQNALKAKLNKNDRMFDEQDEQVKTFVNAVTESRHSCASLCFWKTREEYQLTATGAYLYEALQEDNPRPQA